MFARTTYTKQVCLTTAGIGKGGAEGVSAVGGEVSADRRTNRLSWFTLACYAFTTCQKRVFSGAYLGGVAHFCGAYLGGVLGLASRVHLHVFAHAEAEYRFVADVAQALDPLLLRLFHHKPRRLPLLQRSTLTLFPRPDLHRTQNTSQA